jgi:hypothetical protein
MHGAAPTALGIVIAMPQPCRAGLKFSGRPSGPWHGWEALKGTSGARRFCCLFVRAEARTLHG